MSTLLRIEWLKIRSYRAFWWVITITAISYPAVNLLMLKFYQEVTAKLPPDAANAYIGKPFAFNEIWHTVAYFSSLFIFIPAIVIIMLITNEYTFKTHRQNIIDGWSRKQFLTAKLLDVSIISFLIALLYVAVCLMVGMKNATPGEMTGENRIYFIAYFFLQTFSQLSIAFFIGFLMRKSFIALSVFIFLFLILDPLLGWILSKGGMSIGHFLPFEISDRMIPTPGFMGKIDPKAHEAAMNNTFNHFIYSLGFTLVLWLLCFRINAKRDL